MVSKLRRGFGGSWGKSVKKESCRVRSRLMGERSARVNSAQSQMCGRGGVCRRCYNDIPAGFRGKYKQAVAARVHGLFDVKR